MLPLVRWRSPGGHLLTPKNDARLVVAPPLALVFLAGSMSLFLGAVVSDVAYARTYEIQWNNFASWLLAGALVFAGVALAFALRDSLSARRRTRAVLSYAVVLSAAWVAGFTSEAGAAANDLQHQVELGGSRKDVVGRIIHGASPAPLAPAAPRCRCASCRSPA